jgi:AcrR family transcriptional regulator
MADPPRRFADDAKLRIIAAAESLYASRSIESVSFREIAQRAGNRNTNAVQYHFGDLDTLVQAIFAWRVWQMEPVRGAMLDEAGDDPDLESLFRMLCEPLLDLVDDEGRHSYAAFMSKYLLLQRPTGVLHPGDTRPELGRNLRRILNRVNEVTGAEDLHLGDYRLGLSYLVVTNILVLSDNENLRERDPAQFRHRFEVAVLMAVTALQRSCKS